MRLGQIGLLFGRPALPRVFAVSHDRRNALSSWRISLSHLTTEQEITDFMQAFDACYNALTQ